jgi:hypothetical protein
MSKQIINIGTKPNDGTGDTLRTAFSKTNNNFSELYTAVANVGSSANLVNGSYTVRLDDIGTLNLANNIGQLENFYGSGVALSSNTDFGSYSSMIGSWANTKFSFIGTFVDGSNNISAGVSTYDSINDRYSCWEFGSDGTFYSGGNIVVGQSNNGNESHFIINSTDYWTSIQWKNFTSPQDPNNTPFECQAQLLRVFANDNTVAQYCNIQNPREELVALTAIKPNGTNFNGVMLSTSDTQIPDAPYNDGTGTRHDWIFHGDGTTQLPSMPTNARTGTADALIFTKINGRTGQKVIGTQSGTVDNPVVERLVIAGGDGYGTGEGGDIYLWAGRSSLDANGQGAGGGDIKVDAGDAYDIDGGTIKIRGGNVYAGNANIARPSGWIQIQPGSTYNGGDGADLSLYAGNAYNGGVDGKVTIITGKGSYNWNFGNDGTLSLPGAINKQINGTSNVVGTGDPIYPIALDLTKTINKLTNNTGSSYTLADGVEGQIMYLVPQDGATISGIAVFIAHARLLNDVTTTATVITNPEYFPFAGASTSWHNNIATLIFTDGAWNVSTGSFDY